MYVISAPAEFGRKHSERLGEIEPLHKTRLNFYKMIRIIATIVIIIIMIVIVIVRINSNSNSNSSSSSNNNIPFGCLVSFVI